MIKLENTEVFGWEAAIRGMRNPMKSWDKSDSYWTHIEDAETLETAPLQFFVGENDLKLMQALSKGGSDHGKFLRMINVTVDITAPTVWWAEFDTYKIGTVRNSCSKMHKIHIKPFELSDFTHEGCLEVDYAFGSLLATIDTCERLRQDFNRTHDKKYWRALIELLPEGFNLKATVQLNYQVLKAMNSREHHKLVEWHKLIDWRNELPYFKEICVDVD